MAKIVPEPLAKLNCGTMSIDAARRMQNVTPILGEWTGRPLADLEGQDIGSLLSRGSLLFWETTVEALLENQGYAWDVSLELKSDQDPPVMVLVNANREAGRTDCLFFPYTERRRYESQVQAAQAHVRRHKDETVRLEELRHFRRNFVNVAAHEMATPMTPLKIQFHLLKDRLSGSADAETKRALDVMQSNLDKLAKFSTALVESASIDAGKIGLAIEPLDAATEVPKVVHQWRKRFAPHRTITVNAPPATLVGDLKALRTCLINLLENAVKFSRNDAPVNVEVSAEKTVQIVVTDQGRGIDPDRIHELGRPFVQLHDHQAVTELGAGLGLHIVSGLMKAQGGELHIESEGQDRGTKATLQFPAGRDLQSA